MCYDAKDGYTYCWCSSGDLCNGGDDGGSGLVLAMTIRMFYNHPLCNVILDRILSSSKLHFLLKLL